MGIRNLFENNRPVFAVGILYTITALIVVISAWAEGLRRFDLDITISRYVALRPWTAVLYMAVVVVMTVLAFIYLKRSKMGIVKKVLYILAFICVSGCAFCPFNREWSNVLSDMHNYFAYGLMLMVTVSFILMAIKPANREQRVFSTVAIGYAVLFIVCYVVLDWEFFANTIFLWENTFIYLFLAELIVEYKDSKALSLSSKIFPVAGFIGMLFAWILYLAAPRNGHSIDDSNPPFWNMMSVAIIICLISFIIFTLGFITYMLYRPLSDKRKVLDIVLRVVITPVVIFIVMANVFISIFVFSGAGF